MNKFLCILCLAPLGLFAQLKNALWLGTEYDAGAFEISYQSRSNIDFSNARQLIELSQRVFRKQKISGKLLFRSELDDGNMVFRLATDLTYSNSIKNSPLEFQLRFRTTLEKPIHDFYEIYFRLKNRWLYDFGKHEPYVLWEWYQPLVLNSQDPRLRWETGYTYKLKGPFSCSIFFRSHLDFEEIANERTHIYGFGIGFKP